LASFPCVYYMIAASVAMTVPLDPYLPLRALAGYSGLSIRKLRQLLELPPADALPCYRIPGVPGRRLGGKILVRRSVFDAWIAQYASRGRPSLVKAMQELGIPA
jgi:hypothetical protein